MSFWRWYFRSIRNANPFFLALIAIGFLFSAIGFLFSVSRPNPAWTWLRTVPVLEKCFSLGFVLLIFGATFVFEFMTYKVDSVGLAEPPGMHDGLVRNAIGSLRRQVQMQKTVPLAYKQTFGIDLVYRLWQLRALIFVSWMIAFAAIELTRG